MSAVCKCPNCGARLKIGLFQVEKQYNRTKPNGNGTFHSTAMGLPPQGKVRSFFWFMRGNKAAPPEPVTTVRVISEIKTSPHQMLIRELNLPVNEDELIAIARVYIGLGLEWSRENTTNHTNPYVSQTKHRNVQKSFLYLKFLEQQGPTKYRLTDAGRRFLRHYSV